MTRVLVTGGTGCIGAATTYALTSRGVDEIVVASRTGSAGTLRLWFGDELDPRMKSVHGDVSDPDGVHEWIRTWRPTHIIHLGAFQTPDCDADPRRGMEINVGGTLHLFEAAAATGTSLERVVFASSAAVYGPRTLYPGETVKETDALSPRNLYGVWKLAGEHLARLFHEKTGIPTVCLRLNTTYGKGRDKGKTAAPTTAMKAVALGHVRGEKIPFRMPYFGRENYHYVGDVGAHFAACALGPFQGYGTFNIRGKTVPVEEFLRLIKKVAASLGMDGSVDLAIAPDATPALFVCDLDDAAIRKAFPDLPRTPLEEGIRLSLEAFAKWPDSYCGNFG